MSENKEDRVSFKNKDKVKNKVTKFRDTVMLRVDRSLRDELKEESKRTFVTMSQLVDWALREYLDSVKSLD